MEATFAEGRYGLEAAITLKETVWVRENSKALSSQAAVSPRKLDITPLYRMTWKGSMSSEAVASATLVFPLPGGPDRSDRSRGSMRWLRSRSGRCCSSTLKRSQSPRLSASTGSRSRSVRAMILSPSVAPIDVISLPLSGKTRRVSFPIRAYFDGWFGNSSGLSLKEGLGS